MGGGRRHGFTLIELLVVLVITAALAAVVAANLPAGARRQEFLARWQDFVTDLRAQQARAVFTGSIRRVRIRTVPPAYAVGSGPYRDFPPGTRLVQASGATPLGDPLEILFYPDGSSSGFEVTLWHAGRRFRVRVDPETGRIRTG
ncbi:MAG: prepilin-type N-terminal cleavage/methylation domain-containing protein [Gammaproteobacteria bacterium]|nr:MAG: prepilin-type N-terminal cleavage/methylation domain-containing protein [Gammaproteobacteria bacterium]